MPDDSKKNQEKKKSDPKEQRKPRNSRNQANKQEWRVDKIEESKSAPKVPQKPPIYEDPGPDFYKNLKRETDEILKITEEENSKYKKKEIQSNWSKYEMPIETYEDAEEHDVGADYEKLIQAPLSIGGHFQFKHEKSWDVSTGPSLYDKYFNIDTDNVSLAVSSIAFHERYDIDQSIFSEADISNMKNRAAKYKEKYNNYKRTQSSIEIANKINDEKTENESAEKEIDLEGLPKSFERSSAEIDDVNLDFNDLKIHVPNPINNKQIHTVDDHDEEIFKMEKNKEKSCDDIEYLVSEPFETDIECKTPIEPNKKTKSPQREIIENIIVTKEKPLEPNNVSEIETISKVTKPPDKIVSKEVPVVKDPVIQSPEDLEKWLDDFLDG